MMVASIPIWSALARSIASLVRPLQKLPPPMTMPTCTPASTEIFTCLATSLTVSSSKPVFFGPASASPLNFKNTRFMSIWSYVSFLNSIGIIPYLPGFEKRKKTSPHFLLCFAARTRRRSSPEEKTPENDTCLLLVRPGPAARQVRS